MACNSKKCGGSFILLVALVFLQSSCSANMTGGYMLSAPDNLLYLRITQISNKLTGYMQSVEASDLRATSGFVAKQFSIAGDVSGTSFSLGHNIEAIWGAAIGPYEGSFRSGNIVLQSPSADGRTITAVFRPASTTAWNQAVASFKQKRIAAAYVQRWSDALWNRQRELCNDYSQTQGSTKAATAELQTHRDEVGQSRAKVEGTQRAIDETNDLLAKAKAILTNARVPLHVAKDTPANAEAMDTAYAAFGSACATAADSCRDLVAHCSVNDVKGNLRSAIANLGSAETSVRTGRSYIQKSKAESNRSYASNNLSYALNQLSYAANDLSYVENDLGYIKNDLGYLENELRDAQRDLKDAQHNVDSNLASVESSTKRLAEDSNELDYLSPQGIGALLNSLHKSISIGTVISATTVNEHPSEGSAVLYGATLHTQIAVIPVPQHTWSPVMLPNSKIGWISNRSIKVTYCPTKPRTKLPAEGRQGHPAQTKLRR